MESRTSLSLVIGEIHNPLLPIPAEKPSWLIIPERGLFTGTIIIGAVGSGKTSCCMYPFTDQLLGYRAADPEAKASALVLEVKGDFCNEVRKILRQLGREDDYIEISLDSEWAYNPLHNDLDGYALAYGIASLLNNLFGKGKEPFFVAFSRAKNRVVFTFCEHRAKPADAPLEPQHRATVGPLYAILEQAGISNEHITE